MTWRRTAAVTTAASKMPSRCLILSFIGSISGSEPPPPTSPPASPTRRPFVKPSRPNLAKRPRRYIPNQSRQRRTSQSNATPSGLSSSNQDLAALAAATTSSGRDSRACRRNRRRAAAGARILPGSPGSIRFSCSIGVGRGSWIRTNDLQYPKLPRYQAALYPDYPRKRRRYTLKALPARLASACFNGR
jgi:hypothetical protein